MIPKIYWGCIMAFLIFVGIIGLVYATECADYMVENDLPCDVITPIVDCPIINITLPNSTFIQENGSLNADGTYTYAFPFTDLGDYEFIACDGSRATMLITNDDVDTHETEDHGGVQADYLHENDYVDYGPEMEQLQKNQKYLIIAMAVLGFIAFYKKVVLKKKK